MNGISIPLIAEPRLPWQTLTFVPDFGLMEALSPREMDVLMALSRDGQSNSAIGDELSISEKTVRSHLVHIMLKLGATTRTQVVLTAQRLGLLEEPDKLSATARVMLSYIRANPNEFRELLAAGMLAVTP